MQTRAVEYRVDLMRLHQAERGWNDRALARFAGLHEATVNRFFKGSHRTAATAKAIAIALGYPVKTYIVDYEERASA